MHREVLVDVATGLRVPVDDGTRQLKREVYEFWPGEFLTLFEQAGIPRRVPPPFLPDTGSELASRVGQKPIIVSPNSKEILLVSKKTIPLRAKTDADVRQIFWFAGKQFVGQSRTESGSRVDRTRRRLRSHRAGRSRSRGFVFCDRALSV